jgi:acyl-CoA thioester hydrolase
VLRRSDNNEAGEEQLAIRGRNVYVVVSTEDWAKRPIPAVLRDVLEAHP